MTGSILAVPRDPIIVSYGDSVALIYGCENTPDVRDAGRGLIDTFRESGMDEPLFVLADQVKKSVYAIPLRWTRPEVE